MSGVMRRILKYEQSLKLLKLPSSFRLKKEADKKTAELKKRMVRL